jgi:hypothetical protein
MPLVPEDAPDAYKRNVLNEPLVYMASEWSHPEDPQRNYDFYNADKSEKLNYLIDEKSHLHADNWADINILLFARGCLKTTTMIGITQWFADIYPNTSISMMAPRQRQVKRFMERFRDQIEECGQIDGRSNIVSYRDIDRSFQQKFVRNIDSDAGELQTSAKLEGVSAYGEADAARGDHSHVGVIDEVQDVTRGAAENFYEVIDRSNPNNSFTPSKFLIGTPKLEGSYYADMVSKGERLSWDKEDGEWKKESEASIHTEDGEPKIRVWHIDQWNSPLHPDSEVEYKRKTLTSQKFKNEVLAQFHSAEDNLLAERHIRDIMDEQSSTSNRRRKKDSNVTIGVDWGGGSDEKSADTVAVIGEHKTGADDVVRTEILNVEFLSESLSKREERQRIEDLMSKYEADTVLVDEGHGITQRENLQDGTVKNPSGHSDRVYGCWFGNVRNKTDMKWGGNNQEYLTVDKSYQIERLVEEIKEQKITIPTLSMSFDGQASTGVKLINQLTAPYKDLVETASGTKKVRVKSDRRDDAIDAFTYMMIADRELSRHNLDPDRFSSSRSI